MSNTKILRRVVASALVAGGVAALTPAVAQAKDAPPLASSYTIYACPLTNLNDGHGTVSGHTYSVDAVGLPFTQYDVRGRYSVLPKGATKRVFGKVKEKIVTTDGSGHIVGGGTAADPTSVFYRVDIVDVLAEALVMTSDGVAGCD